MSGTCASAVASRLHAGHVRLFGTLEDPVISGCAAASTLGARAALRGRQGFPSVSDTRTSGKAGEGGGVGYAASAAACSAC
eukprot:262943-Pleurochrysis_carterae.AAC.1